MGLRAVFSDVATHQLASSDVLKNFFMVKESSSTIRRNSGDYLWSTHCKISVILFACIFGWLAVWVFPTDVFLDHGLLPCLFGPRGM